MDVNTTEYYLQERTIYKREPWLIPFQGINHIVPIYTGFGNPALKPITLSEYELPALFGVAYSHTPTTENP